MLTSLLLRLGLAVVDLDLVARALASDILRVHDVAVLDEAGTVRELKRRYAVTAVETGLPIAAQGKVAALAWRHIEAARETQPQAFHGKEFGFY